MSIWKSTPKSSSDEWSVYRDAESMKLFRKNMKTGERIEILDMEEQVRRYEREAAEASSSTKSYGIPPPLSSSSLADMYEASSSVKLAEESELTKANRRIALLEEKMKHMEETFAKTVQDLVESLAKEYDERTTTNEATLDDIPF